MRIGKGVEESECYLKDKIERRMEKEREWRRKEQRSEREGRKERKFALKNNERHSSSESLHN